MINILTERCKSTLNILLKNKITSLVQLEQEVGISKKTLIKDLDLIEMAIKDFNVKLLRKPSVGILLEGNKEDLINLEREIINEERKLPITSKERQIYIIIRLLDSKIPVSVQVLCDELFVSRGTINNEILSIKEVLKQYNAKIDKKQNKGLVILGEEEALRKIYSKMIRELKKNTYLINLINEIKLLQKSKSFDKFANDKIFDIADKKLLNDISVVIVNLENDLGYSFTDEAFVAIMIHILIAAKRIKSGNSMALDEKIISNFKTFREYKLVKNNMKDIENIFGIKLSESELGYVMLHVVGAKIFDIKNSKESLEDDDNFYMDENIKSITNKIIDKIEEFIDLDLVNKRQFSKHLAIHIRPAINRLQNNMAIKNPYLKEIKKKYSLAFSVASECFDILISEYGFRKSEDEIGYIALHIEAELERTRQKKEEKIKVIVLCSSGIGTSQLLSAKIRKEFKNIEIVDTVSVINVEEYSRINEIDFIISTIPFFSDKLPVVNTSFFINEDDMRNINSQIYMANKNKKNIVKKTVNEKINIYNEELVLLNLKSENKEAVIKEIAGVMNDKGYASDDFLETVYKRENIASTAYDNVAIPHGDFNKIIKPCIAIGILEKPIKWDDYNVQVVFLIGLNSEVKKYMDEIFDGLYVVFNSKEKINELIKCKSRGEIISFMKSNTIKGD